MFSTLKAISQISGVAASVLQSLASPDVSREKKMGLATLGLLGTGFVGALGYRVMRNGQEAAEAFARPVAPDVSVATDDSPAITKRSTFDTSSNPFAQSQNKLSLGEATSKKATTTPTLAATDEPNSNSDRTRDRYSDYYSTRKNGVSFAHQNTPDAIASDNDTPVASSETDRQVAQVPASRYSQAPATITLTAGNEPLPPSSTSVPSTATPTLAPPKPTTTSPASVSAPASTAAPVNPFNANVTPPPSVSPSTPTTSAPTTSAPSTLAPSSSTGPNLTGTLLQSSPSTNPSPATLPVTPTEASALTTPATTPTAPPTFAPSTPFSAVPTTTSTSSVPSIGPTPLTPLGAAPIGVPSSYGSPETAPRDPRYGDYANTRPAGSGYAPPPTTGSPLYPPQAQLPPQGFDPNRQEPTLAPPRYAPGAMPPGPALGSNPYAQPTPFGQPQGAVGDQLITITGTESFWNISERTYGNAGYFKALEEYNKQRVADPTHLRTGDVVAVPPVSVLEQNFPRLCPKIREASTTTPSPIAGDLPRTAPVGGRLYRVKDGDTLFDIARQELGKAARWVEIYQLNRDVLGGSFDYLAPGMELVLPENRVGTAGGYATPQRDPSTSQRGVIFPR